MDLPPAVVIHGLAHARAALRPGRPVLLLSGPGAACYAGAGWWRALIDAAHDDPPPGRRPRDPDAIDCDDQPGRALEALAAGCRIVILHPCPAFANVAARAPHARILSVRPPALDLAEPGADRRLGAWLDPPAPRDGREQIQTKRSDGSGSV